jgi:hypothetical protein
MKRSQLADTTFSYNMHKWKLFKLVLKMSYNLQDTRGAIVTIDPVAGAVVTRLVSIVTTCKPLFFHNIFLIF